MKQKQILTVLAMMCCALAVAWIARDLRSTANAANYEPEQMESGVGSEDRFAAQGVSDDAATASYLEKGNRGEALAWLTDASTSRGVARWDKNEVVSLVKEFYAAGAPKVYVVDTVQVSQTEVASQFVVELPTDPAKRKQIFECEANFEAQYDEDATPDTGQKYLHLTTD